MTKYLVVDVVHESKEGIHEVGDKHEVTIDMYNIIGFEIDGEAYLYTKLPDYDGDSYKTWYTLIEEE